MNNAKRAKRLQTLIELIDSGKDVALRSLKLALTEDEWEEYEASVEQQRCMKEMLSDVPGRLKEYVNRLRRADLLYNRAEGMYQKGNASTRENLYHKAESAFENALEYLSECIYLEPNSTSLLDRSFSQNPEDACSPDPSSVPRLVTSSSMHREGSRSFMSINKRSLKLKALKSSLENFNLSDKIRHTEDQLDPEYFSLKHTKVVKIDTTGFIFDESEGQQEIFLINGRSFNMATKRSAEERIAGYKQKIKELEAKAKRLKNIELTKTSEGMEQLLTQVEDVSTQNKTTVAEVVKAIARIKRTGLKIENAARKKKQHVG